MTRSIQLAVPLVARYAALARFASAVSTPGDARYGDYQPLARLERRFGASTRTGRRVERYLRAHGATHLSLDSTGLFVDATMARTTAERLFGGAAAARDSSRIRLPRPLRGLATGVVGLNSERLVLAPAATTASSAYRPATGTPSGCAAAQRLGGFTPQQYLDAYGYSAVQRSNLRGSGESVALIEIDGFKRSDITTFARCFSLRLPTIRAHGVHMRRTLRPGPESTLDLEVLAAAAPHLKQIDVYESRDSATSVLQALTAPLQRRAHHPQVISISLGVCERQLRSAVGAAGIRASSAALELAAASGISVLAASGDTGSSDCLGYFQGKVVPWPVLSVNYPASSPWVTAVGGTNLELGAANAITGEVVWNDAAMIPGDAGGGGLSLVFKRPAYQRGPVHPNRRALPDVAMLADVAPGYDIYCTAASSLCHHGWWPVGGTSAATPLLAGGLALVDQRLRQLRRAPLGFVNPLLYRLGRSGASRATVFNDVTTGDNDVIPYVYAPKYALSCCTAAAGYDYASGWGSVELPALETEAVRRQPPLQPVRPPQRRR